jgi:hypothetical protein
MQNLNMAYALNTFTHCTKEKIIIFNLNHKL